MSSSPDANPPPPTAMDEDETTTATATTTTTTLSVRGLEQAVEGLLRHNFDADSKECIVTLMKVLDNVLQKPGNTSVRRIRLSNKAFYQKVASRRGGVEILLACGFERETPAAAQLLLPGTTQPPSSSSQEEALVLRPEREDTSHIVTARRLLTMRATRDLHIKADQLPTYRPPPPPVVLANGPPQAESSSTATTTSDANVFNPYVGRRFDAKSAAAGAQLGPDSNYISRTALELQALQKKQAALEKGSTALSRDWQLLLAGGRGVTGRTVPTSTESASSTQRGDGGSTDASLLAQRMKRQQEERKQREEGGFTTAAMREVQRLKKKKVYSHVLLTIVLQLPSSAGASNTSGAIQLSGKFLPKETIQTVQEALLADCVLVGNGDNKKDGSDGGQKMSASRKQQPSKTKYDFDLYVTPPRRVLVSSKTLEEEGLVPAAKIYCSVKQGTILAMAAAGGLESLFQPQLLASEAASSTTELFPSSQPIVDSSSTQPETTEKKKDAPKKKKKAISREEAMLKRMMGGGKGL